MPDIKFIIKDSCHFIRILKNNQVTRYLRTFEVTSRWGHIKIPNKINDYDLSSRNFRILRLGGNIRDLSLGRCDARCFNGEDGLDAIRIRSRRFCIRVNIDPFADAHFSN